MREANDLAIAYVIIKFSPADFVTTDFNYYYMGDGFHS